jgi:D-hexose-6-phosphate mutarotase
MPIEFHGYPTTTRKKSNLSKSAYAAAKEGFDRDAKEHNPVQGIKDPNHSGKYPQLQFTIEDEGVFTTPWTATMTFVRDRDGWPEMVCAENIQWYSGKNAEIPRAAKPDF